MLGAGVTSKLPGDILMISNFQGDPSRQSSKSSVIRVSMPAASLYDLELFQKIQKNILGSLGCPGCTSGHDIRWDITREFIVDEKAQIHEAGGYAR